MVVIDASAVLELLLNSPRGMRVAERTIIADETLHAPHLVDIEVAQVLRRYHLAGEMPEARARDALADLNDLPIDRYAHTDLLMRVWELRPALTAYDAVYVALAEGLDAPLVTCDGRLARAHGHRASIELVS